MQLSVLRYPGGKTKAAKILEGFIPADVTSLVSPFFGGGSFENYLARKGLRVRGFDLCGPLVDFWQSYQHSKDAVFAQLRAMSERILAPEFYGEIDKATRERQRAIFNEWKQLALHSDDAFERGVCYFALNRSAFSGLTLIASPMSTVNIEKKLGAKAIDNMEKIQFAVESVEQGSCFDVVANNPNEFLYLDPPYIMETKGKEAIYGKDGELHRGFDHVALRDALMGHKERWVLSYLDVPEVRELYEGCNFHSVTWRYTMKPGNNRPQGKELVVTNF